MVPWLRSLDSAAAAEEGSHYICIFGFKPPRAFYLATGMQWLLSEPVTHLELRRVGLCWAGLDLECIL